MTDRSAEGTDLAPPWWKTAVIYHIYPRAFCDSNGDGWGDLTGICDRLTYLVELGISAIMISPFYPSPMVDGGYDIVDHCDVDPRFGGIDDFYRLVQEAHKLQLRILVDFVGNHVSNQHPWFQAALAGLPGARGRFIWSEKPNGWKAAIKFGSAWTYCAQLDLYYLHCFLPEQPDVNWRDRSIRKAMQDVLRFWLSLGVDGFRVDAAHCFVKDQSLAVRPWELDVPLAAVNHQADTLKVLGELSAVVKSFGRDRLLIGEVFLEDAELVSSYCASPGGGLDLTLNFSLMRCSWDAAEFAEAIKMAETQYTIAGVWPTWVLSNHDRPRHRSRFGGSEGRARVAATILLTLRGTPVLFQGEELGLHDAEVPDDMRLDPAFREGSRAPIPWTEDEDHGWSGMNHPLPFSPGANQYNAEVCASKSDSILSLYRRLLCLRRDIPALLGGDLIDLRLREDWLEYKRVDEAGGNLLVICNFSTRSVSVPHLVGQKVVFHTSMNLLPSHFDGYIEGETAMLLDFRDRIKS
jgi:alpha-glucosidase